MATPPDMLVEARAEGNDPHEIYNDPVIAPLDVFNGIEYIRREGFTNMFHLQAVLSIAETLDFDDAAEWIEDNEDRWGEVVLCGLAPDPDEIDTAAGTQDASQ